jgi:hypothetical protein
MSDGELSRLEVLRDLDHWLSMTAKSGERYDDVDPW